MELVRVERRGDLALVRIDRPPANAMDRRLLAEGQEVVARLREEAPRAVVITGRDGFFSAGADLKLAPTLDQNAQREMVAGINGLFAAWYTLPLPVVAAVNGHAIAGGLILALCADYRVGARHGRFGLTELAVGLPYPVVALAVVRAELSPPAARRLALGAELVGHEEALALGCLDELADDALARALEVAARLAEFPPDAYAAAKAGLRPPLPDPDSDPLLGGWIAG
jgi:enoyl-CoA hydratase